MQRREFLASIMATAFVGPQFEESYGWVPGYNSPTLVSYKVAKDSGKGKVALLWKAWEKVHGPWKARKQQYYDCVAFAAAAGMDLVNTLTLESSSSNMIYGGGREYYAKHKGHGMHGIEAMKWLANYGNLLRKDYGDYDLTKYSKATCKYWDRHRIPKSLIARAVKLPKYNTVRSWAQCCDEVAAGNPVLLCSKLSIKDSRTDKDGFVNNTGNSWLHAMLIAGVDDKSDRKGACVFNSHGAAFGKGPRHLGNPAGSVWVDSKIINKQLISMGECYSICSK